MSRNENSNWNNEWLKEEHSDCQNELTHSLRDEAYHALMREIDETLNTVQFPAPPANLADEVMNYIEKREAQRSLIWWIPGLTPLLSVFKTAWRYLSSIRLPLTLKPESIPVAMTLAIIIWNILIAPQVQAGKVDPYVYKVNQMVDSLILKGETITNHLTTRVNSFTSDLIGEPIGPPPGGENMENMTETEPGIRKINMKVNKGITT